MLHTYSNGSSFFKPSEPKISQQSKDHSGCRGPGISHTVEKNVNCISHVQNNEVVISIKLSINYHTIWHSTPQGRTPTATRGGAMGVSQHRQQDDAFHSGLQLPVSCASLLTFSRQTRDTHLDLLHFHFVCIFEYFISLSVMYMYITLYVNTTWCNLREKWFSQLKDIYLCCLENERGKM